MTFQDILQLISRSFKNILKDRLFYITDLKLSSRKGKEMASDKAPFYGYIPT